MTTYVEERLPGSALSPRRPIANDLFLSNYLLSAYGGCEFACQYCDLAMTSIRPLGETVHSYVDVPARLDRELEEVDPGDVVGLILSEPYQPAEREHRLTRQTLQVLAQLGQPTVILTKSPQVLDDLRLLEVIHERAMCVVIFTLPTADHALSEKLEGRAPPPALRLDAAQVLHRAGIPVGFAMLPIVPYVTDSTNHLSRTLGKIAATGADFVLWDYLGIPNERHRERIDDMLGYIARMPSAYYRDIYGQKPYPGLNYRIKVDEELIRRCDMLGLDVRVPHRVYHRRVSPGNEISLLLRHQAFRDQAQGRDRLAQLHRSLAEEAYLGRFDQVRMMQSPLWTTIQGILNPPPATEENGAAA
jgi:DNA repair photolyase